MVKSNKALFDDVGPSYHLFIIERNWSSDVMSSKMVSSGAPGGWSPYG